MAVYLSMLEEDVKKTYVRLNIMQPEQINVEKIASAFNIFLHYEEADSSMFCVDGCYSIVLDNRLSPERQWEDFAHELCHVLKHYGNQFVMNKMFRQLQEFQANNFMYHFCVPTFMLSKINLPRLQSEAIKLIGDTFKVTYPFAARRLEMYRRKQFSFAWYEACAKQLS
ncbi:ImmA/IrrE family metallo-endopeptidase [Bacillus licheniformis]|uniref:ImmA/IrrE family metallo-endopeptidase n=1 Tax=Bacillus licheniformis TaxID=1402 RepID=UPI00047D72E4|nr:ImmA/IrrE family metallo-endopeptidase [Bacillus licheniformis]MCM3436803.1 ImmA/IrrE family metallo-endopeptidase [Bacillus licheniformis]MDE1440957.1 ImmA/IrrE family metallo-endopeptidase [Bacillus licheniformis]